MTQLRWILLVAGLALIAGVYLWGMRSRWRSAAVDDDRATARGSGRRAADEPPADAGSRAQATAGIEAADGDADGDIDTDAGVDRTAGRQEPRIRGEERSQMVHDVVPLVEVDDNGVRAGRREPTLGQRRAPAPERHTSAEQRAPQPAEDIDSQTAVEARAQRIVALRVVAPLPSRFEGSLLQEALAAEHFEFGRYEIFHKMDESGRPLISLASLREPGTFDPATMAGAAYAGVALFTVLPGPLSAQQAFEQLFAAARSLAATLGGHLQDERGVPLTTQRVQRLREEMLAFDRGRADPDRR